MFWYKTLYYYPSKGIILQKGISLYRDKHFRRIKDCRVVISYSKPGGNSAKEVNENVYASRIKAILALISMPVTEDPDHASTEYKLSE